MNYDLYKRKAKAIVNKFPGTLFMISGVLTVLNIFHMRLKHNKEILYILKGQTVSITAPRYTGLAFIVSCLIVAVGYFYTREAMNLTLERDFITNDLDSEEGKSLFAKYIFSEVLKLMYVIMWGLLLVIPGIIKGFGYELSSYLLMDDPSLSPKEALELSERMMDGHKMELFKLYLSFILWRIASLLTGGVLDIYVEPYIECCVVQFYDDVKREYYLSRINY